MLNVQRIRIGHQRQANLPVFMLRSGRVVCGYYEYRGIRTREFKELFERILAVLGKYGEEPDVSAYRAWNAMDIYEEYIARPWKSSLSARKLEQLAIETEVYLMLQPVREEFARGVTRQWKRAFSRCPLDDPNRPTQGWHILVRDPKIA